MNAPAPPPPPPPFPHVAGFMAGGNGGVNPSPSTSDRHATSFSNGVPVHPPGLIDVDSQPPPGPPPVGGGGTATDDVPGAPPGAPSGGPPVRGITSHTSGRGGVGVGVECAACGKVFSNTQLLRLHSRVHSGERPYKCFCGRTFAHRSSMTAHERTHTGEKPYACDVCNRKFALQSNLLSHKRTHNGTKKYRCEVCQKFFSRSTTLRDHMRLHRPLENPYKCGFCNKYFTTKRSLNGHLEVHNVGNKKHKGRFACVCVRGGGFDSLEGLLTHMQSTSCTASTYMCTLCGNLFDDFSVFLEHTRVAHTPAGATYKIPQGYAHMPIGLQPPLAAGPHVGDGMPPVGAAGVNFIGAVTPTLPSVPMVPAGGAPAVATTSSSGGSTSIAHHVPLSSSLSASPPAADPPSPQQTPAVPLHSTLTNRPTNTSPNSVFFSDAGIAFPGYVPSIGHSALPQLGLQFPNGTHVPGNPGELFPLPISLSLPQSAQNSLLISGAATNSSAPPPPPPPPLSVATTHNPSSSSSQTTSREPYAHAQTPQFAALSGVSEPSPMSSRSCADTTSSLHFASTTNAVGLPHHSGVNSSSPSPALPSSAPVTAGAPPLPFSSLPPVQASDRPPPNTTGVVATSVVGSTAAISDVASHHPAR